MDDLTWVEKVIALAREPEVLGPFCLILGLSYSELKKYFLNRSGGGERKNGERRKGWLTKNEIEEVSERRDRETREWFAEKMSAHERHNARDFEKMRTEHKNDHRRIHERIDALKTEIAKISSGVEFIRGRIGKDD